jgi:hypothetical protein
VECAVLAAGTFGPGARSAATSMLGLVDALRREGRM